jgi:hypothetical protein
MVMSANVGLRGDQQKGPPTAMTATAEAFAEWKISIFGSRLITAVRFERAM